MATLKEKTDILIFSASYGGGNRRVSHAVETSISFLDKGIKTRVIDLFEVISPLLNMALNYFRRKSYNQEVIIKRHGGCYD